MITLLSQLWLFCSRLVMRTFSFLAVLISIMTTAHADTTTGLVGRWKLDEGAGVSALDSSGNGNHGAITGAIWAEIHGRKCLWFDGNDVVQISSAAALNPSSSITLASWALIASDPDPNNPSNPPKTLISKFGLEGTQKGYLLGTQIGTVRPADASDSFQIIGERVYRVISDGSSSITNASAAKAVQSRWQHFAFTYSQGATKFYINGSLVQTITGSSASLPTSNNLPAQLGLSSYGALIGAMRDARIYNRVLSVTDMADLYQAGLPSGPRSQYGFESNVQDGSGNGLHGSASGSPTFVSGAVGRGLSLHGGTDAVSIGPNQRLEIATVSAFVRLDENASGAGSQNIITSWEADRNYVIGIERDAQGQSRVTAKFRKRQDSTHAYPEQSVTSTTVLMPGVFHHAALSYDGSVLRLYVDGHQEASSTLAGGTVVTATALTPDVRVGYATTGTTPLIGSVDDVRVYDRALSAYEIQMLASGMNGEVVYDQDFDSQGGYGQLFNPSGFTVGTSPGTTAMSATGFLGPTGGDSYAQLRLPELPAHTTITVACNLYVIGPWAGEMANARFHFGPTPTIFSLNNRSDPSFFDSTFANVATATQRYPGVFDSAINPAQRGATAVNSLGYGQDAVYHLVKTFPHTAPSLYLAFFRDALTADNRLIGIDNLVVSTGNDPILPESFSLAGTASGTSVPSGPIRVIATTARPNQATDVVAATGNAFIFSALSAPDFYTVRAWIDSNNNGAREPYEWTGSTSVYLDSSKTGINIVLVPPVDSDRDGMSDEWEVEHGLIVGVKDGALDRDGDGLTNLQEYWLGTDVNLADTDGDGVSDGMEWQLGIDPLSAAGDVDGDGMPDAWEVAHGLNPRLNDASDDRDFDFVTNLEEYTNGTNPNLCDSNGDGISDYEQIHGETKWVAAYDRNNRLIGQYFDNGTSLFYGYDANSNPVRQVLADDPDKDRDGMLDIWELANGFNPNLASDALLDSDGDGMTNLQEYRAGTDPHASPPPIDNGERLIGSVALPFTPTNFVVATGQLDGTGADEVIVGGDGNPGAQMNSLRIFTLNGSSWSVESVDVGNVGVTSIAFGFGNGAVPFYVGTRAVAPEVGKILKFTKSGSVWTSSVFVTSVDDVAFATGTKPLPGPTLPGNVIVQYSPAVDAVQRLYAFDQTTGMLVSTLSTESGVKARAPIFTRYRSLDYVVLRQTNSIPVGYIEAFLLGFGTPMTTPLSSASVLSTSVPFYAAANLRSGLTTRPSIFQFQVSDQNGSGTADGADVMNLIESDPSTLSNAPVLTQNSTNLFAPADGKMSVAVVRPPSLSRDTIITGNADGIVDLYETTSNTGPLTKHRLSSSYRGKSWHQMRYWREETIIDGITSGAVGAAVTPGSAATAQLITWTGAALSKAIASTSSPNPPQAQIAAFPSSGTASANVGVYVWDVESNPSRIGLQYRLDAFSAWQNATVTALDGAAPSLPITTTPDGTTHTLAWNALQNVGPSFRGMVLLRTRAADDADTGAWSEQSAFMISTLTPYETWADDSGLAGVAANETSDSDHDGLANILEYAFNLNPVAPGDAVLVPDTGVLGTPVVRLVGSGGARHLQLQYMRRKSDSSLAYTPEFSRSLSESGPDGWTAATLVPVIVPIDSNWERVIVEDIDGAGESRRFARVRVTVVP